LVFLIHTEYCSLFDLIPATRSEQCQMIRNKSALSHPGPMMFKMCLWHWRFHSHVLASPLTKWWQ